MNHKELMMPIENELEEKLYTTLGEFANFLNELAISHRLLSASTASAFIYAIQEDIDSKKFEKKFQTALSLVLKIEMEHKEIVATPFYQSIQELKEKEQDSWKERLEVLEKAFVEKIDLESMVNHAPILKQHVQIGRSAKPEHGNDIIFSDDKTLSRVHLVVSVENGQYFLEDRSANGTFVNGCKLEKGVKSLVSMEDEIRIGREGTLVELSDAKIAKLLKKI